MPALTNFVKQTILPAGRCNIIGLVKQQDLPKNDTLFTALPAYRLFDSVLYGCEKLKCPGKLLNNHKALLLYPKL
jgi:hypothetical protein